MGNFVSEMLLWNLKDSGVSTFVLMSLETVLEDCTGSFLGPRRKV